MVSAGVAVILIIAIVVIIAFFVIPIPIPSITSQNCDLGFMENTFYEFMTCHRPPTG